MGAGSSCGGLGGKAGPQPTRIIGSVIAAVAIRPDNNETGVVTVTRGTKAPPNRRGDGGMIICNLGVTSFVIIILGLIVLFILVGVASRTKDFKLGKIKQVIGSSCNITGTVACIARVIGVLGHGLHHSTKVRRKRRHQTVCQGACGGSIIAIKGFPLIASVPATAVRVAGVPTEITGAGNISVVFAVTQGNGGTPNFSDLEMDLIPAFTGRIVIEPQNENIDRQIGKSGVAHLTIDLDFLHITNGPIVGSQTCGTDFPDGCPTVIVQNLGGQCHFNGTGLIGRGRVVGGQRATLTVIVAFPLPCRVTVTTEPETLTEATVGALEVAVILPSPALVTVMVSVVFAAVSLMEVLFRDKLPAALAMLQATVLAPVLPSAHL